MKVDASICMRCGACAGVCPIDVIEISDMNVRVKQGCTNCGVCGRVCPVGAITFGALSSHKQLKRTRRG